EYETMRKTFLNEQAWLIARDQLRPGVPCPVCGSLEHPNTCEIRAEHKDLSREALDAAERALGRLRERQGKGACACQPSSTLLEEKENSLTEALRRLRQKLSENLPDHAEVKTLGQAEERLGSWKESLRREGDRLAENIQTLKKLRGYLLRIDEKKAALK